jgi:hypothetical protein
VAADAATLAEIRAWVGSSPDNADLELRLERLVTAPAVALEVLRGRLADMISEPAKFTVDGDASWDYSANLKLLGDRVNQLEGLVAGGVGELTVSLMTRSGARR